jgi:hypothetical protein
LLYTVEGENIKERLWQETLEELRFVNVNGLLESLAK